MERWAEGFPDRDGKLVIEFQTTFNSAFYNLHLWNGRADSLWAQAVADNENPLTTNGNRLHTAWLINELYGSTSTVSPNYPAGVALGSLS